MTMEKDVAVSVAQVQGDGDEITRVEKEVDLESQSKQGHIGNESRQQNMLAAILDHPIMGSKRIIQILWFSLLAMLIAMSVLRHRPISGMVLI